MSENQPIQPIPFPEELDHLEQVLALLKGALEHYAGSVEDYDREYNDAKRYMAEYRHEIDPRELFQNELLLGDIERSGLIALRERDRLEKLLQSPYFARIDFRVDGEAEPYYIGRFTFTRGHEIVIFDWRAPVAGMFYDCEPGPAGYDAPVGRIEGELIRKRQFKITGGRMEYALESAVNIRDDVLQRELSSTSDEGMRTIIATLQREQNEIIRNERAETVVIQGVAGSGKTSIALHRVAYLLYRHRDTLSAENVVILSPNRVFGDYISNVLPELGEEPIPQAGLDDIAGAQLDGVIRFAPDRAPLDESDPGWTARAAFKSSPDFTARLDSYLAQVEGDIFSPVDYRLGDATVTAEWLGDRFRAYGRLPVKGRLEEIAGDVRRHCASGIGGGDLPGERAVLRDLTAMLAVGSTLVLYAGFYRHIGRPELFIQPDRHTLEWPDVYPFLYLHAFYAGLRESRRTRHLVIDEMQDYTPVQFAVLNLLFRCKKTILGDFGQSVTPWNQNSLDAMARIYAGGELVRLNRSYRSSYEIISLAGRILPVAGLEPVERHGDEPEMIPCRDEGELLHRLTAEIRAFGESGHNTLGVLVKSDAGARALHERLAGTGAHLVTPDSKTFSAGVTVASIPMSKGLEFDRVIVPFADRGSYHSEGDRRLLYIACTRAMHRLTLLYSGVITPLIGTP